MKIAHLITSLTIGGAEMLLKNICNELCDRHEIVVYVIKNELLLENEFDSRVQIRSTSFSPLSSLKLASQLNNEGFDIIHFHLGHSDLMSFMMRPFCRAVFVHTIHNVTLKGGVADKIIYAVYKLYFKTIGRKDFSIAISKCVFEHLIKTLGANKERSRCIYNCVSDSNIEHHDIKAIRAEYGASDSDIVVSFVGSLTKQKSVHTLIHAMSFLSSKIKGIMCLIIGDGHEREKLENLAQKLGVNTQISFLGWRRDVEQLLASSDIFVLPSIFEGFGLVVVEAMREGNAVIASNLEGPAEIISHGENGFLFTPSNARELASLLESICGDSVLRKKIASNGRKTYLERFSMSNYTSELENLYQSCL